MVILSETEEVRERIFPDWGMERVAPGDIRPVLQDALASAKDAKSTAALCLMLAQFDAQGCARAPMSCDAGVPCCRGPARARVS